MRLVNGSSNSEGRVEVCTGVAFYSVCDDFWNILDALVVCNQLGYNTSLGMEINCVIIHRRSYFSEGHEVVQLLMNSKLIVHLLSGNWCSTHFWYVWQLKEHAQSEMNTVAVAYTHL